MMIIRSIVDIPNVHVVYKISVERQLQLLDGAVIGNGCSINQSKVPVVKIGFA